MEIENGNRIENLSENQEERKQEGVEQNAQTEGIQSYRLGRTPRPRINKSQNYEQVRSNYGKEGERTIFRPEGFGARLDSQQRQVYQPKYYNDGSENNYRPSNNYQTRPQSYRPRYNNDIEETVEKSENTKYRSWEGYQNNGNFNRQQYNSRYQQNSSQYVPRHEYGNKDGQNGQQREKYQQRNGYNTQYNYNCSTYNQGYYQQKDYQQRSNENYGNTEGYYRQDRPNYNMQRPYSQRQAYNQQGNVQHKSRYYGQQQPGYYPYQRTFDYDPNAKYSLKKRIEYKEEHFDPNQPIRLNKFLANAGVCSRREADTFIQAGVITVNGQTVTELGTKVMRSDEIKFNNQLVTLEKKVYVLLNKPKDYVTTSDDPQQRKTVLELVKGACHERIYPVGRLDRNTTGVLLLTNDGDMASKLTHPKYLKKKIYHVCLDRNLVEQDLQAIRNGVILDDGEIKVDSIEYVDLADRRQVGIEIHSGKNRIVRRIFEHFNYRVMRLDRTLFAGLTKKGVRRGDWRYLTEEEVQHLRMGSYE